MFEIHNHHYQFYEGPRASGKPHGSGSLIFDGGARFDGKWVNGELQREGIVTFRNSATIAVEFQPKFHDYPRRGIFKGDYDFSNAQWIGVEDWVGEGPSRNRHERSIQSRVQRVRRTFERVKCMFDGDFDTNAKYEPLPPERLPQALHRYPLDLQYYLRVLGPTEVASNDAALLQVVRPVPVKDVVKDSDRYLSHGIFIDDLEESLFEQLLCAEWPCHHEILGLDISSGTYSAMTLFGNYMNEEHRGFLTFVEDILQGDDIIGPLYALG